MRTMPSLLQTHGASVGAACDHERHRSARLCSTSYESHSSYRTVVAQKTPARRLFVKATQAEVLQAKPRSADATPQVQHWRDGLAPASLRAKSALDPREEAPDLGIEPQQLPRHVAVRLFVGGPFAQTRLLGEKKFWSAHQLLNQSKELFRDFTSCYSANKGKLLSESSTTNVLVWCRLSWTETDDGLSSSVSTKLTVTSKACKRCTGRSGSADTGISSA